MASIAQQLIDIEEQIDRAVGKVNADPGASPALQAVVAELHAKARLAREETRGADERTVRDHVIEAEEAADAAKKAAEADENISEATRSAVVAAHDSMCDLKGDLPD
jgi:hypothetical protein